MNVKIKRVLKQEGLIKWITYYSKRGKISRWQYPGDWKVEFEGELIYTHEKLSDAKQLLILLESNN